MPPVCLLKSMSTLGKNAGENLFFQFHILLSYGHFSFNPFSDKFMDDVHTVRNVLVTFCRLLQYLDRGGKIKLIRKSYIHNNYKMHKTRFLSLLRDDLVRQIVKFNMNITSTNEFDFSTFF